MLKGEDTLLKRELGIEPENIDALIEIKQKAPTANIEFWREKVHEAINKPHMFTAILKAIAENPYCPKEVSFEILEEMLKKM